jgi:hypothetical protein
LSFLPSICIQNMHEEGSRFEVRLALSTCSCVMFSGTKLGSGNNLAWMSLDTSNARYELLKIP